jgi:presenilin-like A22 family membrane protease
LQELYDSIRVVLEQLNPYNTGNQILYYVWLVVYTFTWVAIWRSRRPWLRFLCFVINQVFSVGILMSAFLTVTFIISFWIESLAVFVATTAISLFLFRRRY